MSQYFKEYEGQTYHYDSETWIPRVAAFLFNHGLPAVEYTKEKAHEQFRHAVAPNILKCILEYHESDILAKMREFEAKVTLTAL